MTNINKYAATPTKPTSNRYYLDQMSSEFEAGAAQLKTELEAALDALKKDASNPATLADYQSKLQQYSLFRNAQTTTVKVYKDIGAAIIQNFR